MTETELRILAVLGGLVLLVGIVIVLWVARTSAQRSFLAQGMVLVLLGLGLLCQSLLPVGILRSSLTLFLGLTMGGWVLAQAKFLLDERRERNRDPGPVREG